MAKQIALLIRHGQTTWNKEHRLPGCLPGIHLDEEGQRQAERLAEALQPVQLSAIISSPLERARETAEIIARGRDLALRFDETLVDIDCGHWAGKKVDDLEKEDPLWKAFVERPTQPPPGIESITHVAERAVAAVERHLKETGEITAFVAHADVIKAIAGHYGQMDPDGIRLRHIDNASLTAIFFPENGLPHVAYYNWIPYLPPILLPTPPGAPAEENTAKGTVEKSVEIYGN